MTACINQNTRGICKRLGRAALIAAIGWCGVHGVVAEAQPASLGERVEASVSAVEPKAAFEALPAQLFGPDTALACYADLMGVHAEDLAAALTGLDEVLAPTHGQAQAAEQIAEVVSAYGVFQAELVAAGGTALVLLADVAPVGAKESNRPIRPVLLVGVTADADADALLTALQPLLQEITTAADVPALERVAAGWMRVVGVGRLGEGYRDGAAEHRVALAQALAVNAERPLRMALRITPGLRAQLRRMAGLSSEDAPGPTVLVDPLVAVVREAAKTVAPLQQLSVAVRVAEQPRVETRFWFPTEDEAEAFATATDGFLNLTRQLMGSGLDDTPTGNAAGDPRVEVERLLTAARLTRDGRQLYADFDTEDLAAAVRLGPSLAMMLLMGTPVLAD